MGQKLCNSDGHTALTNIGACRGKWTLFLLCFRVKVKRRLRVREIAGVAAFKKPSAQHQLKWFTQKRGLALQCKIISTRLN